jgi:hypothetical protein
MNKKDIIIEFYNEVCKRAEDKMLKTGKLEGAHFASMKEIIDELTTRTPIVQQNLSGSADASSKSCENCKHGKSVCCKKAYACGDDYSQWEPA